MGPRTFQPHPCLGETWEVIASQDCPKNADRTYVDGRYLCKTASSGQSGVRFTPPYAISGVSGTVSVAGYASCNAFVVSCCSNYHSINEAYVDGVSITQGFPRRHVYSYGIAQHYSTMCHHTSDIPSFVGSNWGCTDVPNGHWRVVTFSFSVTIPVSTDPIEIRTLHDQADSNEDVGLINFTISMKGHLFSFY